MKQQQNKRSNKNYKRNSNPARLLKTEYIALDIETGAIKADFDSENELQEYLQRNQNTAGYLFKTYQLNNKQIKTNQKLED